MVRYFIIFIQSSSTPSSKKRAVKQLRFWQSPERQFKKNLGQILKVEELRQHSKRQYAQNEYLQCPILD